MISRQDVIDALDGFEVELIPYKHGKMYVKEVLNAIFHRLNAIPSIDSKVEKAHWVIFYLGLYCSECNYKLETTWIPDRCPKCGARMKKYQ